MRWRWKPPKIHASDRRARWSNHAVRRCIGRTVNFVSDSSSSCFRLYFLLWYFFRPIVLILPPFVLLQVQWKECQFDILGGFDATHPGEVDSVTGVRTLSLTSELSSGLAILRRSGLGRWSLVFTRIEIQYKSSSKRKVA